MSNNFEVGMVHDLCPCCLKKHNESIIIPTRLNKKTCDGIKEADGKAVGFSICTECEELADKGYVALIGIDPAKSNKSSKGTVTLEDIWRTGKFVWLKKDVAKDVFNWDRDEPFILLEDEVFAKLNIPLTPSQQEND